MEKINPSDLVRLPVTDIRHVVKEINWWRQYKSVNEAEKKRRSIYMQVYRATHKNKEL